MQRLLHAQVNSGHGARDFAGDKRLAADRTLVIEQNSIRRMNAIRLAVVHSDPEGVQLGHSVGASWIKGCGFILWHFPRLAVKLRGRRLIEARLFREAKNADRLQNAQGTGGIGIRRVFRRLKAYLHVTLRGQVVNLIWLHRLNDANQIRRVGHISVMNLKMRVGNVRILVHMIDARRVKRRRSALDAVHNITLTQQEFGQIGAVLSRNTRY